jgi:hypothetical protein
MFLTDTLIDFFKTAATTAVDSGSEECKGEGKEGESESRRKGDASKGQSGYAGFAEGKGAGSSTSSFRRRRWQWWERSQRWCQKASDKRLKSKATQENDKEGVGGCRVTGWCQ